MAAHPPIQVEMKRWKGALSFGVSLTLFLCAYVSPASGQANGNLQIHFINVGQGDGAILISPQGQTVMFDNGVRNDCGRVVSYLQSLGVARIDYHIASHYHADHIGCTTEVLGQFPLQVAAYDRGGAYNSATFRAYVDATGEKRQAASEGMTITLDASTPHPVVITVVALNGNGIQTTNENDLSLVAVIKFGGFRAVIGGDLSGYKTGSYEDIESSVALKVGQVDVYKVHHHCSRYSTNSTWLEHTQPRIGIISTGNGNDYGHPAPECLERLHNTGVRTYWTETGAGGIPEPGWDAVCGHISIQVQAGASNFTVTCGTQSDSYALWDASTPAPASVPRFAWSSRSGVYHYAECRIVRTISPGNLQRGDTPPPGKTLHQLCPLK